MRILFYCLASLILLSCQADRSSEVVVASINAKRPLGEDPEASAKANSNQALTLRMGEVSVAKGDVACLPVVAQNFKNLIGFQYTIQWDSTQLAYHSIRNFKLPGYGPANFGDRFTSRGYLSTLWTEAALQGTSLPDNSPLFELCLTNLSKPGTEAAVRFVNGPTTFEVIAADMSQWKFRYANGLVISQ